MIWDISYVWKRRMGIVPPSMGDRCESIGHFRDERSESEKLSEKTQESFREESGKNGELDSFQKALVTEY